MNVIPLSQLVEEVSEAITLTFGNDIFLVKAEVVDVKKQAIKSWCFAKLIEKRNADIVAEIRANFWQPGYAAIQKFEQATGTQFADGLEVICAVRVRFHPRYGLSVDVVDIDVSHALGNAELDRQKVLQKLLTQHPDKIMLQDGEYITPNNQLPLPPVIQRIALITAANSDGQRDFLQELSNNSYGYAFAVHQYLTTVQGNNAHVGIMQQLSKIKTKVRQYDAVIIVRGGGSQTDFKPFDEYDLAEQIAFFPIPILCGIGHDRNTSIADLMATQLKTPTKVAAYIVERNLNFQQTIVYMYDRISSIVQKQTSVQQHRLNLIAQQLQGLGKKIVSLEMQRWHTYRVQLKNALQTQIKQQQQVLQSMQQRMQLLDPVNVLNKGYAIVRHKGKVVQPTQQLNEGDIIETQLSNKNITSKIQNIS